MKSNKAFALVVLLAGLLFTLTAVTNIRAQDAPAPPDQDQDQVQGQPQDQDQSPAQDPPTRVARLDYSTGSVSMQPNGEGDWVQAVTNRPLTAGDNLWADKESRAELGIGSTDLRMDSETSITFLDLDDHTTQIKLSLGSLIVKVRHLDDGDTFEVDTPNLAFDIQNTGEYRLDVNADGNLTNVTVRQGRGEAIGAGESYMVVAGQQARFSGTDTLDHEIAQLPAGDDFDQWSASRDSRQDQSESANYVSPEMTGYEDLDEYGSWTYEAGYGACWSPRGVAVDWAPYRYGHWVWIAPWGWTWVEDEPWGFAPFHYGRWAFVSSRWFWVPGRVFVRPVYAPALVAFVGGGGFHLSVGVGGPGVAWFPLAPGEVYMPWYRTSRGYVNHVNITNTRVNITQVTNVYNVYNSRSGVNATRITYVNQRRTNAVTAVSRDTFVNARPVSRNFVRVDEKQIAAAPAQYRPDEQPVRGSVLGAGAPARYRPPAAVVNRQVVGTRVPPTPRGPFQQSQPATNVRTESVRTPQPGNGQNGAPNSRRDTQGGEASRGVPSNQNNMPRNVPQPHSQAVRPSQPVEAPRGAPNQGVNVPQSQGTADRMNRSSQPLQTPREMERQNSNVPRPDANRTQPGNQGNMPQMQQQRGDQSPQPSANQNRSQVRSAPPVQERPEVQRNEQQKFDNWQQQRQRSQTAPRAPAREAAPRPAPQHSEHQSAPAQHNDHKK